jgi:hypothetical protein
VCVVHLTRGLLLLYGLGVLDFLSKQGHVLGHRGQMLKILGFKLGVLVHIVFRELFFDFFLFVIHESVELFNVELALSEVEIGVKLVVYH